MPPWEKYQSPTEAGPWERYGGKAAPKKRGVADDIRGAAFTFNRNFLPFADEVSDAVATAGYTARDMVMGDTPAGRNPFALAAGNWKGVRDQGNRAEADFAEARPLAAAATRGAGIAGSVAVPAGAAGNVFANSGRAMNAVRGATVAGSEAALYAGADRGSLQERVGAASRAARDPVTLALGAGAGALATSRPKRAKAQAPSLPQLQKARDEAYAAADQSGVRYSPEAFSGLVEEIKGNLASKQYDPDFEPTVATMVRKMEEKVAAGYAPTLSDLDNLRKFVGKQIIDPAAGNKTQRMRGRQISGGIDNFIETADDSKLVEGVAGDASSLIRNARDLHGKVRKIETVEAAMERATRRAAKTGSGGNIDNTIRQEMDKVLERTPNLSKEERAILESIVYGDKGQNALRQIGKFSPSGNGLSQWFNLGAVMSAGPMGAIPAVGGWAAKSMSDAQTRRKVQELVALIANGSPQALLQAEGELAQASGPAADALRRAVAARLARASGVQGASRVEERRNLFAQP